MSRAFTLVELMVVIGIIAVLMALLSPVVSRVRTAGLSTQCISNLRQVGMGVTNYLADNGNIVPVAWANAAQREELNLPYSGGWIDYYRGTLPNEDKKIVGCPAQRINKTPIWSKQGITSHQISIRGTYGFNALLTTIPGGNTTVPKSRFEFENPAATLVVGDGDNSDAAGQAGYYNSVLNRARPPEAVHSNHANCLFLDGHVAAVHRDKIPKTTEAGSDGRLFWHGTRE